MRLRRSSGDSPVHYPISEHLVVLEHSFPGELVKYADSYMRAGQTVRRSSCSARLLLIVYRPSKAATPLAFVSVTRKVLIETSCASCCSPVPPCRSFEGGLPSRHAQQRAIETAASAVPRHDSSGVFLLCTERTHIRSHRAREPHDRALRRTGNGRLREQTACEHRDPVLGIRRYRRCTCYGLSRCE